VIDEQIIFSPHRIPNPRLIITERRVALVVGRARLALFFLFKDLIDVQLLHCGARDAETVLVGLGKVVSLVVKASRPINFEGAVVTWGHETLLARSESLSVSAALRLAELAFEFVAERLGVLLGVSEAVAL